MKVLTSDNHMIDFDVSQSRMLMDLCEYGCIGVARLPIHSDILTKLQSGTFDESWEILCAMMRAADFLYMPDTLDQLGQHMAGMLRGKSAEQVRKMMSILS